MTTCKGSLTYYVTVLREGHVSVTPHPEGIEKKRYEGEGGQKWLI